MRLPDFACKPLAWSRNRFHRAEWLAFESMGWKGESMDILKGALIWQARYLDYPEMLITREDPRRVNPLKLLNSGTADFFNLAVQKKMNSWACYEDIGLTLAPCRR